MLRSLIAGVRALLRPSQRNTQIEDELQSFFETSVEDKIRGGMTPEGARRAARIEIGSREMVRQKTWSAGWEASIESFLRDLRFASRQLRKSPGFALTVIGTLALGIGANTAVFSVVNSVLLRPLPYKEPGRLVWSTLQFPKREMHTSFVPHPTYFAWRDQNHVFSAIAAAQAGGSFTLTGEGVPERIRGTRVSAGFFSVLDTELARGRSFTAEEDRPEGPRAAILTNGLWQSRYAGDPNILGRMIALDDKEYAIVGVLPADFESPTSGRQPQVFLPLAAPADASSAIWYLNVIARLKPGVTFAQAEADLSIIDDHTLPLLPKFFARFNHDSHLSIVSLHDQLTGNLRDPLLMLMAAVGFILLIACANIANLQLSRGSVRSREFILRAALGASRSRLGRQLLTETMLLSAAGGMLGWVGAFGGVMLLRSFVPRVLLNARDLHVDAVSLAFTVAVSIFAGTLAGFAPILAISTPDLSEFIRYGKIQVTGSRKSALLRNLLAAGQVAAAAVLLVAAGLLLNSFLRLTNVRSGFDPHNLLTAQLFLPPDRYAADSKQVAFAAQLLEHISGLPGVRAVSLSTSLPNTLSSNMRIGIEGRPISAQNDVASFVPLDSVSEGYFHTLGIRILSGRGFDSRDGPKAVKVAVVDQEFARVFFARGENPIGKRILIAAGTPDQTPVSIVGVTGAIRRAGLTGRALPQIFQPFAQAPSPDITILLRTATDPSGMVPAVRSQVLAIDKELPLANVATMDELLAGEIAGQRFEAVAVGLFASLALVLAGIGVYGVVSYMVSRRIREIGIRTALGAQRANVLRMVMRDGVFMAGAGTVIGTACSLALTRLLRSLLFQVGPTDPVTYAAVIFLLFAVALLACYVPAHRATKVDPMVALRYE
jgi:putative ABC transport system permease protein